MIGLTGGTTATTAANNLSGGPPTISLSGYQGITPFTNPFIRLHKLWQVAYAVTHNVENHSVRLGGEYRHFRMDIVDDSNPEGSFTFTGRYTGNSVADLLLGYPSATTNLIGPPVNDENSWQLATYAEDNWRVSSSLTLTYGLRYEYQTPDTSSNNLLGAFVPSLGSAVVVGTNGVPEGVRNQYCQNFAPRAGIVWDPTATGNHTIRGNYGYLLRVAHPQYLRAERLHVGADLASGTVQRVGDHAEHLAEQCVPSSLADGTLASVGRRPAVSRRTNAAVGHGHPAGNRIARRHRRVRAVGLAHQRTGQRLQLEPAAGRARRRAVAAALPELHDHYVDRRHGHHALQRATGEVRAAVVEGLLAVDLLYAVEDDRQHPGRRVGTRIPRIARRTKGSPRMIGGIASLSA